MIPSAQNASQIPNMSARIPGNIRVSILKPEIMKTAWPVASRILQNKD
jgi:hypothetical protein